MMMCLSRNNKDRCFSDILAATWQLFGLVFGLDFAQAQSLDLILLEVVHVVIRTQGVSGFVVEAACVAKQ